MDPLFHKQKHLLHLFVKEPIPAKVKPTLAAEVGEEEACIRYQAILLTLLQQFDGIENTDIVINTSPAEALDAIKFWILPALEDASLEMLSENSYLFKSKKSLAPTSLVFQSAESKNQESDFNNLREKGYTAGYNTVSIMGANCPECGSRWLQMAQMFAEKKQFQVEGRAADGSYYLTTYPQSSHSVYQLPTLRKIKSQQDWEDSLSSVLGTKLKKQHAKLKG